MHWQKVAMYFDELENKQINLMRSQETCLTLLTILLCIDEQLLQTLLYLHNLNTCSPFPTYKFKDQLFFLPLNKFPIDRQESVDDKFQLLNEFQKEVTTTMRNNKIRATCCHYNTFFISFKQVHNNLFTNTIKKNIIQIPIFIQIYNWLILQAHMF